MTVKQDIFGGKGIYLKLKPVEFYEYLARVANAKYQSELDTPLDIKLERILDLILPPYGLKRN